MVTDEEKVNLFRMITDLRSKLTGELNEGVDAILEEFVGPILPRKEVNDDLGL